MLEKKNENVLLQTRIYHYKGSEKDLELLRLLCHISKNIYNRTLYKLRDRFFKGEEMSRNYIKTRPLVKFLEKENSNDASKAEVENIIDENYSTLNTYMSGEVIANAFTAVANYTTYYNANGTIKDKFKGTNDEKWIKNRRLPKYLPKCGYYQISTSQIQRTKNNHYLLLPLSNPVRKKKGNIFEAEIKDELLKKFVDEYKAKYKTIKRILIKIPNDIVSCVIHNVRIIPINNGKDFNIAISYELEPEKLKNELREEEMGIDCGVNVLMACGSSNGDTFLVDGKGLKEILSLGKRDYERAQAKLPRIKKGSPKQVKPSKYMYNVYLKCIRRVDAYLNKAVAMVFNYALNNGIRKIYVGWNKGLQKGGIKSGKMTKKIKRKKNKFFCSVPFRKLINKLINKGLKLGIEVLEVNESYTSKKSFFDGDSFDNDICSGKRIRRGQYRTKSGKIVHADINAAFNILAKYTNLNLNSVRYKGLTTALRERVIL